MSDEMDAEESKMEASENGLREGEPLSRQGESSQNEACNDDEFVKNKSMQTENGEGTDLVGLASGEGEQASTAMENDHEDIEAGERTSEVNIMRHGILPIKVEGNSAAKLTVSNAAQGGSSGDDEAEGIKQEKVLANSHAAENGIKCSSEEQIPEISMKDQKESSDGESAGSRETANISGNKRKAKNQASGSNSKRSNSEKIEDSCQELKDNEQKQKSSSNSEGTSSVESGEQPQPSQITEDSSEIKKAFSSDNRSSNGNGKKQERASYKRERPVRAVTLTTQGSSDGSIVDESQRKRMTSQNSNGSEDTWRQVRNDKIKRPLRPCSPSNFSFTDERGMLRHAKSMLDDPQIELDRFLSDFHSRRYVSNPSEICDPSTLLLKTSRQLKNFKKLRKTGAKPQLVGLNHHNTLGVLVSPLYKPAVEDLWSQHEIAVFESAMCAYGKRFHCIQKVLKTKSTREVIDFYYVWKKTSAYSIWKESRKFHAL